MMEVVVVTTGTIRRAKLQSNRQYQRPAFMKSWMLLFLSPN